MIYTKFGIKSQLKTLKNKIMNVIFKLLEKWYKVENLGICKEPSSQSETYLLLQIQQKQKKSYLVKVLFREFIKEKEKKKDKCVSEKILQLWETQGVM